MITTVTLNPAVDKTIFVDRFVVGNVNRVDDSQLDPAGKGINVSRLVDRLDWPTVALGFIAGDMGRLAKRALDDEGVQNDFIEIGGETRLNVTVQDTTNGTGTNFYDKGPDVRKGDLALMDLRVVRWLKSSHVLVLAGSLPPGVPEDTYARYTRMANSENVKVIVDSQGESLRLALGAGAYLIKPNVSEAEDLLGRKLPDRNAVVQAAKELGRQGVKVVVISMGSKGAICAAEDKVWYAQAPAVPRVSTVGSGDSMVAGLAIAIVRQKSMLEGLRLGSAAGAATAMSPGTSLGSMADIESLISRVVIEEIG